MKNYECNHKHGDTLNVRLKTFDEIKALGYKYRNRSFHHPSAGIGANLSLHRNAEDHFGRNQTVTLKYIKVNRTIWKFTFRNQHNKLSYQMVYGDWFDESIFEEELFEI